MCSQYHDDHDGDSVGFVGNNGAGPVFGKFPKYNQIIVLY
jgi:hypothetical protein